jgi:dTDP-4-dehydrorhamnose reductase
MQIGASILRVNFIGRGRCQFRETFTDWVVNALRSGRDIELFSDVSFSPLNIRTLCGLIESVLRLKHRGILNLGSRSGMTKAEAARQLADELGLSTSSMISRSVCDFRLQARRPKDMRMEVSSAEKILGFQLPMLQSEIADIGRDYLGAA